jgi:hypothetical protein
LSIDDEGFLSKEIDEFRNGIRSKHRPYFDLVERLNRYCSKKKDRLLVHNRDGQELLAACLLIKLLNDVQAAVILLERGLASQGRSILRVALECLVVLAKIVQSYDFVHAYVKVGEQERLKLVNAIKQNPDPGFDDVRTGLTDDLIVAIKETIGETQDRRNVEQWAKEVGLGQLYDGTYRLFSQEVHSSPRAIDQYFLVNAEGKIIGFEWRPDIEKNFRAELTEAATLLLVGISAVDKLFQLNIRQDLKDFSDQLSQLGELEDRK